MNTIKLRGCTTEPMINYLKSLGVFRIISKQVDGRSRALWTKGCLSLQADIDESSFTDFLLEDYGPSPLFGPWGAWSGFYDSEKKPKEALDSLLASEDERFLDFRESALTIRELMRELGVKSKPKDEDKLQLLIDLRSGVGDEMIDWLDTCYVLSDDSKKFMPVLGTGGNEGNGSYFSVYLQALDMMLLQSRERSRGLLENSLYSRGSPKLEDISPGQFSPGSIAEVNATEGYRKKRNLVNPWDFILAMEGSLMFAGMASRRYNTNSSGNASFPFIVTPSASGSSHLSSMDSKGYFESEIWVPVWTNPASLVELETLFGEGRAMVGRRQARDGLDFARSVSSLGVDRGIGSFVRYGRMKRQGSGTNANAIAVPLGQIEVRDDRGVDLIADIDTWLGKLRRACSNDNTANKLGSGLRRLEDSIFRLCAAGGRHRLLDLLMEIGRMERTLSMTPNVSVPPFTGLHPQWVGQSYDGTPEFRIALSLASVYNKDLGPLRLQMEPIKWDKGRMSGWANDTKVVWTQGSLPMNLSLVLKRRMMEASRSDIEHCPSDGKSTTSLADVQSFIEGTTDDVKINDLIWAFNCLRWGETVPSEHLPRTEGGRIGSISRAYAALKLVHLPGNLVPETSNGSIRYSISRDNKKGIRIAPTPEILSLLMTGRGSDAISLAYRRIKVSGLTPLSSKRTVTSVPDFILSPEELSRIGGALLIPIWEYSSLANLVIRVTEEEEVVT
jgi:CRISPR-associated protein Csx17